jgi:hypothetical protein
MIYSAVFVRNVAWPSADHWKPEVDGKLATIGTVRLVYIGNDILRQLRLCQTSVEINKREVKAT